MKNNLLDKKPIAFDTIGKDIFIEMPLYETKEKYKPLYINKELFSWYFNDKNTDFSHMSEVIADYFSTTIDKKKSKGKSIGYAWADRQADPMKISLSDNLGSGRAFYQYDIFNIKGEKTPLAKSKRDEYSNGVLELEKSIFETIASNSLYDDWDVKLSPILAILDTNEDCTVTWKDKVCKRAKAIRLDMQGSLNRVTHIFYSNRALKKQELINTARQIGIMEGEKLLHRIEHGAWSAGNISENAHMIDFDTVCAVKYRAPQFSFSKWYIDNYFGHEYIGQLKLMKLLVDEKEVNVDNVEYELLEKELLASRMNHIYNNFSKLIGFEKVDKKHLPQISKLVDNFIILSAKCYPVAEDLALKFVESQFCSPFNFSKFFRHYPILKRKKDWSPYNGVEYILDCVRGVDDFDINNLEPEDEGEEFFVKTVLKELDKHFIHSFDEFMALSKDCLNFVKDYDALYDKLLDDNLPEQGNVETKAYIINQDRHHLYMPNSMAGPIDDERDSLSYEQLSKAIETTILSNKRSQKIKQNGLYLSNMEIFKEGYFATLHNNNFKHKLSLNFHNGYFKFKESDCFEVKVNGKKRKCKLKQNKDIVSIQSPFFDNKNLLKDYYKEIIFYKNNRKISMNNFLFSFTEYYKTNNFAEIIY